MAPISVTYEEPLCAQEKNNIENMGKYYIPSTHTTSCTMTGYHDYVLGLIPAFVLGPIAVSPLVGLSLQIAVAVGGAAAAMLVAHAMFVRGPVPNTTVAGAAVVDDSVTTTEAGTVTATETASPTTDAAATTTDNTPTTTDGTTVGPAAGPATGGD
jgi:hypothetical protein